MKLYTETTGSGPDLFLVHGWGMNAAVWNDLRDSLQSHYRITRVDLPGHGRSPRGGFDLDGAANALLDAAPSQATWVGWSLGGQLALASASRAPERIARLCLVASSPHFVQEPDWPHAISAEVLEQFMEELRKDVHATLNRFLALQVRGSEAAGATLRDLRRHLFEHGDPDPEALASGLAILRDTDLRAVSASLRMPVQFILGERDTLMPAAVAAQLPANIHAEMIRGAGHAPFLSHPQAFLEMLLPFLQETRPASGVRHHAG